MHPSFPILCFRRKQKAVFRLWCGDCSRVSIFILLPELLTVEMMAFVAMLTCLLSCARESWLSELEVLDSPPGCSGDETRKLDEGFGLYSFLADRIGEIAGLTLRTGPGGSCCRAFAFGDSIAFSSAIRSSSSSRKLSTVVVLSFCMMKSRDALVCRHGPRNRMRIMMGSEELQSVPSSPSVQGTQAHF